MPNAHKKIQTGARINQKVVKLLKAVATFEDVSLGELIERMALRNFTGQPAFNEETLEFIESVRAAYGVPPSDAMGKVDELK